MYSLCVCSSRIFQNENFIIKWCLNFFGIYFILLIYQNFPRNIVQLNVLVPPWSWSILWQQVLALNQILILFTSTILIVRLGSPVLGYLAAGILIGPYGLSIIRHVHGTKAIAEFGVVFLLFNIGLEVTFFYIPS